MEENKIETEEPEPLAICHHCGDEIEPGEEETATDPGNGREVTLCESCRDDHSFWCQDCDVTYYDNDGYQGNYIEDYDRTVCSDCLDNYHTCDWCNRLVHRNDVETNGGVSLCVNCSEDAYTCVECGRWIHSDDTYSEDGEDDVYCQYCWERRPQPDRLAVHSSALFHDIVSGEVRRNYEKLSEKYYGIEIEFDNCRDWDNIRDLADLLQGFGCLKSDGSLDNGKEITLPPMSPAYIMGPGRKKLDQITDLILEDCNLWAAKTAGIHIHRDRAGISPEVEAGLIYLFWICREEISKIAGRKWNTRKVEQYCNYGAHIGKASEIPEPIKDFCIKGKHKNGRYHAVNCSNYETLEFRVFQATGRVPSILGYFGLADTATSFADQIPIDSMIEIVNSEGSGGLWAEYKNFINHYPGPLAEPLAALVSYRGL